jgi:hypothetical protein
MWLAIFCSTAAEGGLLSEIAILTSFSIAALTCCSVILTPLTTTSTGFAEYRSLAAPALAANKQTKKTAKNEFNLKNFIKQTS